MVAELIDKPRHEAVDGDLVIYSTETAIVHAGHVRGQGVCSKAGSPGADSLCENGCPAHPRACYYSRP